MPTAAPSRSELIEHLIRTRIAGDVATPRENNLAHYRELANGNRYYWLGLDLGDRWTDEQDVLAVMAEALPIHPVTRWGKPMSVGMTAAGGFGWVSDRRGYRYEKAQADGRSWPAIPTSVLAVWDAVSGCERAPECCLVNLYRGPARMGLHQDRDEADFTCPVVSISLGDDALFRVGGLERGGSTESLWLRSGDVCAIGGPARLVHHGVDRLREGSSDLVPGGGRINLTLRVVT